MLVVVYFSGPILGLSMHSSILAWKKILASSSTIMVLKAIHVLGHQIVISLHGSLAGLHTKETLGALPFKFLLLSSALFMFSGCFQVNIVFFFYFCWLVELIMSSFLKYRRLQTATDTLLGRSLNSPILLPWYRNRYLLAPTTMELCQKFPTCPTGGQSKTWLELGPTRKLVQRNWEKN